MSIKKTRGRVGEVVVRCKGEELLIRRLDDSIARKLLNSVVCSSGINGAGIEW